VRRALSPFSTPAMVQGGTQVTRNSGHAPPLGWSYAPRTSPTVGPCGGACSSFRVTPVVARFSALACARGGCVCVCGVCVCGVCLPGLSQHPGERRHTYRTHTHTHTPAVPRESSRDLHVSAMTGECSAASVCLLLHVFPRSNRGKHALQHSTSASEHT